MATTQRDSATKLKWHGRWNELKGRVKEVWGELTDDDLDVAEGEYEQLIGRIETRTGESWEEIDHRLAREADRRMAA